MLQIRVLKLGNKCFDKATELAGTLTHWVVDMGGNVQYMFQPEGLDEEGQPLDLIFLCPERLKVKETDFEDVDVPMEILGTEVTDKASRFKGMAVDFIRHINGCFHVSIQPAGKLKKSGERIKRQDFDLRRCTGKMITAMSEDELEKSKRDKPSPMTLPSREER